MGGGRKRKRAPGANTPRQPAPSKCRDCGVETTVPRFEFFKANRPRCVACGGLLEYGGHWRGTRSPRDN